MARHKQLFDDAVLVIFKKILKKRLIDRGKLDTLVHVIVVYRVGVDGGNAVLFGDKRRDTHLIELWRIDQVNDNRHRLVIPDRVKPFQKIGSDLGRLGGNAHRHKGHE